MVHKSRTFPRRTLVRSAILSDLCSAKFPKMFEGISVQFVVDVDEVREELAAADLKWPIVKILDSEEEEEERDAEDYPLLEKAWPSTSIVLM
jgi:hypothetical protein